jgi:putative nucleotidyltransferase with HDIG domain
MIGYVNAGIIGLVAFFVPLLVLRISQAQHIQHTKSSYNKFRKDSIAIREKAQEISNLNEELLLALANVIDLRDPYVLGHSQHVARYAAVIAEELGMQPANIELIRKASLLHDIGKPSIPEAILFKVDDLTNQEFDDIKKHSVLSAEIIRNCQSLQPLVPIIRHHHERYDGTGYPDGLKGNEIPFEARIISLADALEAMASDRPYRKALSWAEILSEIQAHAGTQFDPVVVKAFTNAVGTHGESILVNPSRASQIFQPVFFESALPIHSLQLPKTGPRK